MIAHSHYLLRLVTSSVHVSVIALGYSLIGLSPIFHSPTPEDPRRGGVQKLVTKNFMVQKLPAVEEDMGTCCF